MRRLALPAALILALAACGQQAAPEQPGPGTVPDAAASSSAPDPVEQSGEAAPVATLDAAIAGEWRSPEHRARDAYRHPKDTLQFFGIRPDMTVIEITPGGAGWYAEILAPYLRDQGRWIGAVVGADAVEDERARTYYQRTNGELRDKLAANPVVYGAGTLVEYDPKAPRFGEPGSADAVLTFRNVHNWMGDNAAEGMFAAFHEVLKPGGVLGVVEHRAASDVAADDRSGYVGESQVIALAEAAGFRLEERSEVNANPADTRDHPNGVWTLPPSNRHDEADAEKYRAIGESDRMTLRFRKPADEAIGDAAEAGE
jgi:predicted methyltransferase